MDLGSIGITERIQHGISSPTVPINNTSKSVAMATANVSNLETVRALHQTIVSLRTALEQSRAELQSLKLEFHSKVDPTVYTSTIEKLSIENHILRQKVISSSHGNIKSLLSIDTSSVLLPILSSTSMEPENKEQPEDHEINVQNGDKNEDGNGSIIEVNALQEDDEDVERKVFEEGDQSLSSADTSTPKIMKGESEESEELDDIELIFTTDDTKELDEFQEDLVSIADSDKWHRNSQEKSDRLKKMWTTQSVLVETDISKCGVVDENDAIIVDQVRRNTMPNPPPYRPIIHREALSGSKSQLLDGGPGSPRPVAVKFSQNSVGKNSKTMRPILVENNTTKQESEAQTDITALPAHWRSESYLAHKVAHNFTTLPSKFALPVESPPPRKHSLKLCEKTQEARRVLLSDINFTSMVPELSRSADHLCNETINTSALCKNYPRAFSYMKNPDSIMSPNYLSRAPWSPCDCSNRQSSWECYHSSAASMHSPSAIDLINGTKRRHSMRPSTSSIDTYWGSVTSRPNWSVPSSPTHCRRSRSIPLNRTESSFSYGRSDSCHPRRSETHYAVSSGRTSSATRSKSRVTFKDSCIRRPGQSLPDLRLTDLDSGEDSTESLIDESEEFLRRSIDCMMTGGDYFYTSGRSSGGSSMRNNVRRHHSSRRHSDPDPGREFEPPKSAQPFLARVPRDLKLDYCVKVISSDGRVVVGRVRYIGPVQGQTDAYIGVQLPHGEGNCDGTFEGRRYFDGEPDCAIFVPFKKVVMAWAT